MVTPFDTGGCEAGRFLRAGRMLSEGERSAMLDSYTLQDGATLSHYGANYLAAHFRDPLDYVRRPQQSDPDHKPYHGLESDSGDRLAWTIEVRVHDDVPVPPERLLGVVLQGRDLLRELPVHYRRLASVPMQMDGFDFGQGVAQIVLTLMEADQ